MLTLFFPNPLNIKVEAVYRALAAEAVGGSTHDPHIIPSFGGKPSGGAGSSSSSSSGSNGRTASLEPAGLLHATISRYFDEGPALHPASHPSGGGGGGGGGSGSVEVKTPTEAYENASKRAAKTSVKTKAVTEALTEAVSGDAVAVTGEGTPPHPPPPHDQLDKRACEMLVRDASVLLSDPSFQGRLDAAFDDDNYNGGSGNRRAGGGLGFFDVVEGTTAAAGGGGGRGGGRGGEARRSTAPHAWLLKVAWSGRGWGEGRTHSLLALVI